MGLAGEAANRAKPSLVARSTSGVLAGVANDTCANATPIAEGATLGNNVGAGPDDAEASCAADSNHDVWFQYTATCSGPLRAETTGSALAPNNDTVLSVFEACGGTEIACDNDGGAGLLSSLVFTTEAEFDYFLRVAGAGSNVGDITLTLTPIGACAIDGVCFLTGQLNPANDCEACSPGTDPLGWTARTKGSNCGDGSSGACDSPDACDGLGVCEANHKPDGFPCDDADDCTELDACLSGICLGESLLQPPDVAAVGPRSLDVTAQPTGSVLPIALQLTTPDYVCVLAWIAPDGALADVPIFQTPDEWGTVRVLDDDVVPAALYEVRSQCGAHLSAASSDATWTWGDGNHDGNVDVSDVICVLDGFTGVFPVCPIEGIDLVPCEGNGKIDVGDILGIIDAFAGLGYPCAVPCAVP